LNSVRMLRHMAFSVRMWRLTWHFSQQGAPNVNNGGRADRDCRR
jgi:hypothetical protein